jgi:hypothetical protein
MSGEFPEDVIVMVTEALQVVIQVLLLSRMYSVHLKSKTKKFNTYSENFPLYGIMLPPSLLPSD